MVSIALGGGNVSPVFACGNNALCEMTCFLILAVNAAAETSFIMGITYADDLDLIAYFKRSFAAVRAVKKSLASIAY